MRRAASPAILGPGMGIVWAALDPDLERAVAIKLLRSGGDEPTLRARLLREARAMARLKHPNVLTVYEVGTVQNRDYIAMELVDGASLDAWLATRPPREQIIDALLAAGRGLAAAHAAGLVHRDFKPHNALRSRDGHVYVTDFGLARGLIEDGPELVSLAVTALPDELATGSQLPLRRASDSVLDSPLTQTGILIGTPAYMAPEQFAGRAPDARSDQFAFCVTAWEALAGVRPFRGATLGELEAAAGRGAPSVGDIPQAVRAVLARGLDPSPERRWPDMHALLRAFGEAPTPPPPPRRARRWLAAAAGAAALALAGGLVYVRSSGGGAGAAPSVGECGPAEAAFGGAWSPSRRDAVVREHHDGTMIAGIGILDEVREHWLGLYRSACAEPRTARSRALLACLGKTRDKVDRVTARLAAPGSRVDFDTIVTFSVSLAMCDVNISPGFGGRLDRVPDRGAVHRDDDADDDDDDDDDADDDDIDVPGLVPPGGPRPPPRGPRPPPPPRPERRPPPR